MNLTVLCYKKCSTCQKALKWLDANGISYVAETHQGGESHPGGIKGMVWEQRVFL